MPAREVIDSILNGDADDNLDGVYQAYSARHKLVRATEAARIAAQVKEGTRVRISNITPKAYDGCVGTVERIIRGRGGAARFDVKLDRQVYARGVMTDMARGVPASCLTVAE